MARFLARFFHFLLLLSWRSVEGLIHLPRIASAAAAAALVAWDPTLIKQTESFLTNPVLEALRKAEQWEQDVPTAPNAETTKVLLLYPIAEIAQDLAKVSSCLESPSALCVSSAAETLKQPKFQAKTFKKIFNRYSDNIFYSSTTSELTQLSEQDLLSEEKRLDVQDALSDVSEARAALDKYLALADPQDLATARALMKSPAR